MRITTRLLLLLAALTVGIGLIAPSAAATSGVDGSSDGSSDAAATTTTIDNSFLDTERDISECINNALPEPDCGREPTDDGDRGGALQLATFGVLTLGIAFIVWRVVRSVRARDAAIRPRS